MALGEFQGKKLTYWGLDPRTCDSCRSAPATLFCRPDSAFLCATCNARVHSANKLASRHDRVPLCEVCEHAPAAVTCKADAAALCVTCDNDIHSANPLARRHDRVPIVPFYDLAAINSDSHNLMISDDGLMFPSLKITGKEEEEVDYFFSDADPYLDLDYSDSVVPVQGKPALGPPPAAQLPAVADFSSYSTYSVCSSEVGVVPDAVGEGQVVSGGRATSGVAMDREARVMRYREKRKNRRFEKTIRYASRKAYAETRPRIKGRFVKRTKVEVEEEKMMMNSGMVMGIAVDGDYGLVPSF